MTLAALDFWRRSGWHLLDHDSDGMLVPSADFILAYLNRPELVLVEKSCNAEKALHEKLTEDPFALIDDDEITAMADPDIIENYRAVLAFRDFMTRYGAIETTYKAIADGEHFLFPPLFVDQLCHVILREILKDEIDPICLRAAEIMFRSQVARISDGRIMIADQEIVNLQAGADDTSSMNTQEEVQIDVLTTETADSYWERSENFDTALDIAFNTIGANALGKVIERWIRYFLHIDVSVTSMLKIEDENWLWHIGLDSESSTILDDLFHGKDLPDNRLERILCMFKLEAEEGFSEQMTGKPVYLALSQNAAGVVRMKPQNLLINLPLKET
jgi:hypothetical protein